MSDYGIKINEFKKFTKNSKSAMGILFDFDCAPQGLNGCIEICKNSYKKLKK